MKSTRADLSPTRLRRPLLAITGIASAMILAPTPARAHAFGARYDLPLPLDLYLVGAAAAVALSFVIMAIFFRVRRASDGMPWRVDLLRFRPMRVLLHPAITVVLQVLSVGAFLLILGAGLFGVQDTMKNIAPVFVWIIWWVGLAYVAALAGNVWPVINPWSIIYSAYVRLARHLRPGMRRDLGLPYPPSLGVWPAVALFAWFAWLEMLSVAANIPHSLAVIILFYSAVTWLGMAAFGRRVWLAHGEVFSLAFDVFGRFAPIGRPERDAPGGNAKGWYLRPYAGALVVDKPCSPSMTVFVLLMLATVTFDGFKETPLWGVILRWAATSPSFQPIILGLHNLGFSYAEVLKTSIFAAFPMLFVLVFLAFTWLTRLGAENDRPLYEVAGLFVLSLVPIAIAYHLAHYLSYLLLVGQSFIPLLSDPFGFGWDIFGTANYRTNIGIIGAKFVWRTAVVAIVIGHVCAVAVAHFVALGVFATPQAALRSQFPFMVLMVSYTMLSLWILAQPIVESPSLSTLTARSGTVTLAHRQIREACVDLVAQEKFQYEFQTDGPVDFDIHFHDGLAIHYPVQAKDITAHSGTFAADTDQTYCLMWWNQGSDGTSLTYRITGP